MKMHAEVTNSDNIEMTMTVTMTLREWILLRDEIKVDGYSSYVSDEFCAHINSIIVQAEKVFYPKKD